MKKLSIITIAQAIALFGNLFFILWIVYNGIDEGFQGTFSQILSYIGLVVLLTINSMLVLLVRPPSNG